MNILVSFCNTMDTPGYPNLGVINIHTKEFKIVDLPPNIAQTGMLGLSRTSNYILIGQQHISADANGYNSPPALLILDKDSGKLVNTHTLRLVKDIHSFLWNEDNQTLFVVSTGTDEVISIELRDTELVTERVYWSPVEGPVRKDTFHLNSIFKHKNEVLIAGFGPKSIPDDWSSAVNGFIRSISADKLLVSGLQQPHSIDIIDDQIAFCESGMKRLWVGNKFAELSGYTRGLCHTSHHIFAGTSASRKKSKSTGRALTVTPDQRGGCTITQFSKDLQIEFVWDLNDYAFEIYEMILLDDVSNWPLIAPVNFRAQFESTWIARGYNIISELKQLINPGDKVILVDDSLMLDSSPAIKSLNVVPFLEKDGIPWGPPADDSQAVQELLRMKKEGAKAIVFTWPSFWYLDYYKDFSSLLNSKFVCREKNEDFILFDISPDSV